MANVNNTKDIINENVVEKEEESMTPMDSQHEVTFYMGETVINKIGDELWQALYSRVLGDPIMEVCLNDLSDMLVESDFGLKATTGIDPKEQRFFRTCHGNPHTLPTIAGLLYFMLNGKMGEHLGEHYDKHCEKQCPVDTDQVLEDDGEES